MFTIPNAASAEHASQATIDSRDFDILAQALLGTGVLTGCAVTPQGSPNMTLAVASGSIAVAGTSAAVTGGNVTVTTAHATLDRFDLVVVDAAGVKSVVAGTAATAPVFPDPAGKVVLAAVRVPAAVASINAAKIVDKRATASGGVPDGSITGAKISGTLKPSGSATAGTESLRALGATASTAAAGNDARLSDTRVPTVNTVDTASMQAGAVTTTKIAAGAVTPAKMSVKIAGGRILFNLATNEVQTVAVDLSALGLSGLPGVGIARDVSAANTGFNIDPVIIAISATGFTLQVTNPSGVTAVTNTAITWTAIGS